MQLPPPVHGASMMNRFLKESDFINKDFNIEIINFQFNKSTHGLEKFTFRKIFKASGYGLTIIKKMIKFKPDLVYFNFATKGFAFYRDAFYVFLIKRFNSKIVFHLHSKGIKKITENSFLKKNIYKYVFKDANVICLSKTLSLDIENVYKSTPYIVPNGIPIEVNDKQNLDKEDKSIPQILCLSNYIRNKGILVLIEALEVLRDQNYLFFARLVGGPEDLSTEMLEKIIEDKNLASYIKVVGPMYGEDKLKEFKNADIFVLPSFTEAFPLVLLEAMQFELPIISTLVGGIPEMIIDNESGMLAEPENVQMLAEKISILLNDKVLRSEMGKKGCERFKNNYTLRQYERNIHNVFNDILNTPSLLN